MFFCRPLTVVLLLFAVAAFVVPHLPKLAAWRKKRQAFAEDD